MQKFYVSLSSLPHKPNPRVLYKSFGYNSKQIAKNLQTTRFSEKRKL